MTKKIKLLIPILLLLTFALVACSSSNSVGGLGNTKGSKKDNEINTEVIGDGYPLEIKDYFDYVTKLEHLPERVAVLSGTPLNIWYDLGGKSICSSNIKDNNIKLVKEHREEILGLPVVGEVFNLDMEAVVAQKPDLVITQAGVQSKQTQTLRDMGIPVIATLAKSFDDVVDLYRSFGKILEQEALAEEKIQNLSKSRDELLTMAPKEGKKVAILYLTANSLSVKLDNSIAGDIANSLNFINIASSLPPDTAGSENTPLDIEYIVQEDPDIIFVTSMISSNEEAVKTMTEHFTSNQAWQSVNAVKEGNVIYLPQEYYLYNAGPYYNEAIRYMGSAVYPEIYGELGQWYGK